MNTYVNDRKLAEYPFFDTGASAPPPGCIRYLGVCLRNVSSEVPVYASAISISMDGVLVSLCRDIAGSDTDKLLGSVYASATDGRANIELTGGTVTGTVSMLIDKTLLQNSFGNYTGKFYLDPSCVTYMDSAVEGSLNSVRVNGTTYSPSQGLNFTCMGSVVELADPVQEDDGSVTSYIRGTTTVDTYALLQQDNTMVSSVDAVNEITLPVTHDDYPTLTLLSGNTQAIQFNVLAGDQINPADLVVEIIGTKAFPNCYETENDEAPVPPVQEVSNAADNEQP